MFDPVQKSLVEVPVYDGDHMKAGAKISWSVHCGINNNDDYRSK